jgi:hypothetical protein
MARPRRAPTNEDPTIDADLEAALHWIKGDGDKHARLGEIRELSEFFCDYLPKLSARTIGDHWVQRDRRQILLEITRRAERAIGIMIEAAQERGQLGHRGFTDPRLPKLRELIGSVDDQPMRVFASWTDTKFESVLDTARKVRHMTRAALLRIEAGEPASIPRVPRRYFIEDEATQRRVYTGAIMSMDGMASALKQLGDIHPRIKQGEREQWLEQLSKHRAVLTRAMHKLRTQPKPPSPPPSSTSD